MLAITGRSAGGLLASAVLNMRPGLCKAAVLKVPFVDVLGTVSDDTLPFTAYEYEEWGDPSKPEVVDYIKSYCPLVNLGRHHYPHVLCVSAVDDALVSPIQVVKYVQQLRKAKADHHPVLLRVNEVGCQIPMRVPFCVT